MNVLNKPDIFHLWLVDMSGHRIAAACIVRADLESMNMIRCVCVCVECTCRCVSQFLHSICGYLSPRGSQ